MMAGTNAAHSREITRVSLASGNFSRSAAIAGVVSIKSPIRLSWIRRMFTKQRSDRRYRSLSRHLHSCCVGAEQSPSEMVPGEVFHDACTGGGAHAFGNFRMLIEML